MNSAYTIESDLYILLNPLDDIKQKPYYKNVFATVTVFHYIPLSTH